MKGRRRKGQASNRAPCPSQSDLSQSGAPDSSFAHYHRRPRTANGPHELSLQTQHPITIQLVFILIVQKVCTVKYTIWKRNLYIPALKPLVGRPHTFPTHEQMQQPATKPASFGSTTPTFTIRPAWNSCTLRHTDIFIFAAQIIFGCACRARHIRGVLRGQMEDRKTSAVFRGCSWSVGLCFPPADYGWPSLSQRTATSTYLSSLFGLPQHHIYPDAIRERSCISTEASSYATRTFTSIFPLAVHYPQLPPRHGRPLSGSYTS